MSVESTMDFLFENIPEDIKNNYHVELQRTEGFLFIDAPERSIAAKYLEDSVVIVRGEYTHKSGFLQPVATVDAPALMLDLLQESIGFSLCPECGDKYAALRYDPTCNYSLNSIPLSSLVWPDEHPEHGYQSCCKNCQEVILRLANARTELWKSGKIPEDMLDFWNQAQANVPDWPGFKRLALNDDQRESLDACKVEFENMMDSIAELFPNMMVTEKGGGLVELMATRAAPEPKAPKPWWQVWK